VDQITGLLSGDAGRAEKQKVQASFPRPESWTSQLSVPINPLKVQSLACTFARQRAEN